MLLAAAPANLLAQSQLMPQPYVPVRLETYSAFCALWRTDAYEANRREMWRRIVPEPIAENRQPYHAALQAADMASGSAAISTFQSWRSVRAIFSSGNYLSSSRVSRKALQTDPPPASFEAAAFLALARSRRASLLSGFRGGSGI
jgi:hypothetical protein